MPIASTHMNTPSATTSSAKPAHTRGTATSWGVAACLFWCTSVAVLRCLTDNLGPLRAGMLDLGLAGALGIAHALWLRRFRHDVAGLSWAYLLACGSCFVIYQVCLLLAIGLAADGPQVIVVGMLNYLWPALTLALSVPLLHRRWRAWLIPGLILTIAGESLVVGGRLWTGDGAGLHLSRIDLVTYTLAVLAAISWAFYSNLSRKLARGQPGNAVPLFLLASAIIMAPFVAVFPEPIHLTAGTILALFFAAIMPGLLAYTWWDRGMRLGNAKLLTIVSYLIPLGSTAATGIAVRTWPQWPVWTGALLVIGGAVICHSSVLPTPQPAPGRAP